MIPAWLHILSVTALLLGLGCALVIAADLMRHPQHMAIMNAVWPITALFGGPAVLWAYFKHGRLAAHERAMPAMQRGEEPPHKRRTPFAVMVGKGALHCGAGCTLGDIGAEWLAFGFPAIALAFGWRSIFAEKMFAVWIFDFILAYLFGIVFQYMAITPMRGLPFLQGVWAAVKADTLSLAAWQSACTDSWHLRNFIFSESCSAPSCASTRRNSGS